MRKVQIATLVLLDECVVEAINLCGDDTVWKITDKILLACENQ